MKVICRGYYITYYCPECGYATARDDLNIYTFESDKKVDPVWTSLYYTPNGCFNVEFGEEGGPEMVRRTATALAWNYLVKNPSKVSGIYAIGPGGRDNYGW